MNLKNQVNNEFTKKVEKEGFNISDFSYILPQEKIAQYPVKERDMSKLLIWRNNIISESLFHDISEYIPADHMLVVNNTRVVRARLLFKKDTGAYVEVFCIEPLIPYDYERSFSANSQVTWKCIVGNLKKWKSGKLIKPFRYGKNSYELTAEKLKLIEEAWEVRFTWNCPKITFAEVLEINGHIPLPPYIGREDKDEDINRYQTVYAQIKGSVAAPTAGLHFTDRVFEKLLKNGIKISYITLHVGAGTFQPIKTESISAHEMHCEHFIITSESLQNIINNAGRIIAVGTTSVRTLESLYWIGIKLQYHYSNNPEEITLGQWEHDELESDVPFEKSLSTILEYMNKKGISTLRASTKIMIIPGYNFRIVNGIITNFHQPASTLLLLISAWTGNRWRTIYDYALNNDFRFLSYGDCSLLFS